MEQNMVNYYELLGLPFNYTLEDLQNAYKHFVDRIRFLVASNDITEFEQKKLEKEYQLVKQAYLTLCDPKEKDVYDQQLVNYEKARYEEAKKEPIKLYLYDSKKKDPHYKRGYVYNPKGNSIRYPLSCKIKDYYEEIKDEEKNKDKSYKERHDIVDAKYEQSHRRKKDGFSYKFNLGTVHVFSEFAYQLSKIANKQKDDFPKYVIRNRRFLASVLASGVLFTTGMVAAQKKVEPEVIYFVPQKQVETVPVEEVKEEVITPAKKEVKINGSQIVLNRYYTIERGDTLTNIANNANSSRKELKEINHMKSGAIYAGNNLIVPYTISSDNIDYYTSEVKVYNYSLEKIAEMNETDVDTLVRLNPEAIEFVDGQYLIISDSIVVPNFITKADLSEIKRKERFGK